MEKESEKIQYISLKDAAQFCNYSQEYLSLRARQGKLKATKIGRNWLTTHAWILEYVNETEGLKTEKEKEYDVGEGETKWIEPPANIPTEDSIIQESNPYVKRISASPFSAFKVGAVLSLIFALVGSGSVFGKEGWYEIAKHAVSFVEDFGKGFDTGFEYAIPAVATHVSLFGEGFETGVKTLGNVADSAVQTFGEGFDGSFRNTVADISSRVVAFGQGFDTGLAISTTTLDLGIQSFGQGFDGGVGVVTHALASGVQSFGQGFDTEIGAVISAIPSYVLSFGDGF